MKRLRMLFAIVLFCMSGLAGAMENHADRAKIKALKIKSFPALFTEYNSYFANYQESLQWHSLALNASMVAVPAVIGFFAMGTRNRISFSQLMNNLAESLAFGGLIQTSQHGWHFGRDKLLRALPLFRLRGKWHELKLREQAIREKVREEKIDLLPYLAGRPLDGYAGTSLEVLVDLFNENDQNDLPSSLVSTALNTPANMVSEEAWNFIVELTDPAKVNVRNHALGVLMAGNSSADKKALCQFVADATCLPIEFVTANDLPIKMSTLMQGQSVFDKIKAQASSLNELDQESRELIIMQRRWFAAIAKLHIERGAMESAKARGNGDTRAAAERIEQINQLLRRVESGNRLLNAIIDGKKELSRARIAMQYYEGNRLNKWYRWARGFVSDRQDDYMVVERHVAAFEDTLEQNNRFFIPLYTEICNQAGIADENAFNNAYENTNSGMMVLENVESLKSYGQLEPAGKFLLNAMQELSNKNVVLVATADRPDNLDRNFRRRDLFQHVVELKAISVEQRRSKLLTLKRDYLVSTEVTDEVINREIAAKTEGLSFEDLSLLFEKAKENATKNRSIRANAAITLVDLKAAIAQLKTEAVLRRGTADDRGDHDADLKNDELLWIDEDPGRACQLQDGIQAAVSEMISCGNDGERTAAKMPGILFFGPAGTGKTLTAEYIAYITGCPMLKFKGSDFVNLYVGQGARNVRAMFDKVDLHLAKLDNLSSERKRKIRERRERHITSATNSMLEDFGLEVEHDAMIHGAGDDLNVPLIVFIDEIESLGAKRAGGARGGDREYDQTLTEMLAQMDGGIGTRRNIIIIGATNKPEHLDEAFKQRFRHQVNIDLPRPNERVAIVQKHMEKGDWHSDSYDAVCTFAGSPYSQGWSARELSQFVQQASATKQQCRAHQVQQSHISHALWLALKTKNGGQPTRNMLEIMGRLGLKNISRQDLEIIGMQEESRRTQAAAPAPVADASAPASGFGQLLSTMQHQMKLLADQNMTNAQTLRQMVAMPAQRAAATATPVQDQTSWLRNAYANSYSVRKRIGQRFTE